MWNFFERGPVWSEILSTSVSMKRREPNELSVCLQVRLQVLILWKILGDSMNVAGIKITP